jgi:hypothetical protein
MATPSLIQLAISHTLSYQLELQFFNSTKTMANKVTFAYSGFGPRTQIVVALRALYVLLNKEGLTAFAKKHGGFVLDHHIFEKQGVATGGGNAFQSDTHGMINGGLGLPLNIPGIEKLSEEERAWADDIVNLPKRVAEATAANRHSVEQEYARISAAAPIMLDKAFGPDGYLNTNVECATRGFVGQVAQKCFERARIFAEAHIGDLLHITVHEGTTVIDVDITDPQHPELHLEQDGKRVKETFDFVTLAHGTTLRAPVAGKVAERSYDDIPNVDKIGDFLARFSLLDTKGSLKPEARIAIGGLSLSMLDMLMIVLRFTGIVIPTKEATRGYRLDEAEAAKYKDLLLLFNREPGSFSGLRTKYDTAWEGVEPLLAPEEAHAAWMHDGGKTLLDFLYLARADVAASCGKLPEDINRPRSTEDRAADYNKQIDAMHTAWLNGVPNLTESALYRAAVQSLLNGQGLSKDPTGDEVKLEGRYPISRAGTAGWPIQRALLFADSRIQQARYAGNADLLKRWQEMQNIVASAPWVCLGITADLMECGVIRYQKGSYEDIKLTGDGNGLVLGDHEFDVLFAPKIIDVRADPILSGLRKKVLAQRNQPVFAKGRYYQAPDGTTTHVCDVGLVGHGGFIEDIHGNRALINAYWGDTNARLSALQLAPAAALTGIASAVLLVKGEKKPLEALKDILDSTMPSDDEYQAEIDALRSHFQTLKQKLAMVRLAAALSKDTPHEFKGYHDRIATAEGRKTFDEEIGDIALDRPELRPLIEAYRTSVQISFNPLPLKEHRERFVDILQEDAQKALDIVME